MYVHIYDIIAKMRSVYFFGIQTINGNKTIKKKIKQKKIETLQLLRSISHFLTAVGIEKFYFLDNST